MRLQDPMGTNAFYLRFPAACDYLKGILYESMKLLKHVSEAV